MEKDWTYEQALADLPRMAKDAEAGSPQYITVFGEKEIAVISDEFYNFLLTPMPWKNFKEALLAIPKDGPLFDDDDWDSLPPAEPGA